MKKVFLIFAVLSLIAINPLLNFYKPGIEKKFSKKLHNTAHLKQVSIHLYGYRPHFKIKNFALEKTVIKDLRIGISIFASLWQHQAIISSLYISGAELDYNEIKKLLPKNSPKRSFKLIIEKSMLITPKDLPDIKINKLHFDKIFNNILLRADLQTKWGNVVLSGYLNSGKFSIKAQLDNVHNSYLSSGKLTANLQLTLRKGLITAINGKIVLQDLTFFKLHKINSAQLTFNKLSAKLSKLVIDNDKYADGEFIIAKDFSKITLAKFAYKNFSFKEIFVTINNWQLTSFETKFKIINYKKFFVKEALGKLIWRDNKFFINLYTKLFAKKITAKLNSKIIWNPTTKVLDVTHWDLSDSNKSFLEGNASYAAHKVIVAGRFNLNKAQQYLPYLPQPFKAKKWLIENIAFIKKAKGCFKYNNKNLELTAQILKCPSKDIL